MKPCGTRAAYVRHRRNGETPCGPCREANRLESDKRRRLAGQKRRPVRGCGTYAGWWRHYRQGQDPCYRCWVAAKRYWRNQKTPRPPTSISVLVSDVLETWGYAMTADVIASKVTDIRPEFSHDSVHRTVWRMAKSGVLVGEVRLGEKVWRLNEAEDVA